MTFLTKTILDSHHLLPFRLRARTNETLAQPLRSPLPPPNASVSVMAIAALPPFSSLPRIDPRSLRRTLEFCLPRNPDPYLPRRILCCSGKKSRRRRALKSNEELRDELREFMSTVGLPEDSLPSLKELCENGRKDLANIVRRRGYKAITELLLNSTGENHSTSERNLDSRDVDSIASTGGQERVTSASADCSSSASNYSLESIVKTNGALLTENCDQEFEGLQYLKNSLHIKADKFVQTGELDTTKGEDGQLYQDLASEALEEDNQNEVDHLKRFLEQKKELSQLKQQIEYEKEQKKKELSQLKQQIEIEKLALRNLQARAKAELGYIQRSTAKKDEELRAVEECLNGLKEVHIDYWTNGQIVELAGSFNGWQHRVKMDLHPPSEHTNSPEARKPFRWTTVLWLYPGVYEIKFIVDGDWRIDSQREIITSGGITNNVLRVDG